MVIEAAKPRVSVLSLCEKGDAYIMAETGKVFKKEKDMKKGKREKENILLVVYGTKHERHAGLNLTSCQCFSFSISCICTGVDKS